MSPASARDVLAQVARLAARRERDARGAFVVEGVAPFLQVCGAGLELEAIVHCEVLLQSPGAGRLVRLKRRAGVPVTRVGPEVFRDASRTVRASGVAAIARQRWRSLEEVDPRRGLCWLVMERIRSPGNLGTILRTAEAAGAAGLVLLGPEVDPYDPRVVRASMGAAFHLDLVRTSRAALVEWARRVGARLVGTSPGAAKVHTDPLPAAPLLLLLGEERRGLGEAALAACDEVVRIPVLGRGDSLNVAVAAGVVLYEVLRQRSGRANVSG